MKRRYWPLAAIPLTGLAWFGWRHWNDITSGHISNISWIATAAFLWLAAMMTLAHAHTDVPQPRSRAQKAVLKAMNVTVVVPVYNEDPNMFRAFLESLSQQTRMPQRLIVIDDGSTSDKCRTAFNTWYATIKPKNLEASYIYQRNAGKREAQAVAFRQDPDADIYVTIDSDVHLDPHAIEYGLLPFNRRRTMSVAGFLIGANKNRNLLYRLIELGFVSSFLNGRAQYSTLGSVTVNAGGLAFYRGCVIRENLDRYLTQTVMGRKVSSGDDAMLTRYALLMGRTVFQRCAFGYTLHPTSLKHLTNQRVRWWRSFFWGNVWMIRNFPMRRIAWWIITWDFITFAWMSMVMPIVLIIEPMVTHKFNTGFFLILLILSYIQNTKFLSVKRTDESYASQLLTFTLAPLCSLLQVYLGWCLQYIGLATFAKTGWSTRAVVEVTVND